MRLSISLLMSLEWFLILSVAMSVLVKSSYGRRVIYMPGNRTADPMLDARLTLLFESGLRFPLPPRTTLNL